MEALLTQGFGIVSKTPEPVKISKTPEARIARSAAIFAAIWLALAVGSPLIVRYGPSTDDHAMAALATRMEVQRCASTPKSGLSCSGQTLVARDVDAKAEPDL